MAGILGSARCPRRARTSAPGCKEAAAARRASALLRSKHRRARRLEPGEIVAGMVRRTGQRRGRDHQEPLALRQAAAGFELVRGDKAFDGVVLRRRLKILADGEEIEW